MTAVSASAIEAPSGKDAAYENFPVGSWLLPAAVRPHVQVFYAYARAIDDIADSPDLAPEVKVARLQGFEDAVLGRETDDPAYAKAHAMRASLAETGIAPQHCVDLIAAFTRDATQLRYRDWDDLMGYCLQSAAPVGRYLLDLHGGSAHGYGPADALCNALQVINHVQDCQDDYRTLDRVYLPMDWMAAEGIGADALDAGRTSPALRRVLDRTLDRTEALLAEAGLAGGFETTLSFNLGLADWQEPAALLIQESLAKVGIRATLDKIPGANWRTACLVEKRLPMHLENFGGWLNYPDYYFFWAYKHGHLFNSSNYKNDEVEKLVDDTLHMAVTDPRYAATVKRMMAIAFADVPRIPLYQPYLDAAMQTNVGGYASWFHRQLDVRSLTKA